jgi:GAF domain-containing protein
MQTFLGAPIVLRRIPYGNLYLAEKGDGEAFSAEDEEPLLLLAAQAAVAIEMTRQREAAARRANQLESLNQIGKPETQAGSGGRRMASGPPTTTENTARPQSSSASASTATASESTRSSSVAGGRDSLAAPVAERRANRSTTR